MTAVSKRSLLTLAAVGVLFPACRSQESKACAEGVAQAQEHVLKIDPKNRSSVEASLRVVETTIRACRAAGRGNDIAELEKARNELSSQVSLLERRAARGPKREVSLDEIGRLEKNGDPSCPKGQAYRREQSKEIRCTGPQLVEMSDARVETYFKERDYLVRRAPPATVEVERGAERFAFRYAQSGTEAPPVCLILYPTPDTPWQEATSRATGVSPAKLKSPTGKLSLPRGALDYVANESTGAVRIGDCPP